MVPLNDIEPLFRFGGSHPYRPANYERNLKPRQRVGKLKRLPTGSAKQWRFQIMSDKQCHKLLSVVALLLGFLENKVAY